MTERIKRPIGIPAIQPVPVIVSSESSAQAQAWTGLLSNFAGVADKWADKVAVERGREQGLIEGANGAFVKRNPGRLSGAAFNQSAEIALRGKLDSDFKVHLQQAEAEYGSDLGAFQEDMNDFLAGQTSEVGESNPVVAKLHGMSVGPSYAAVTRRVQAKHDAEVDDRTKANLITYGETMQRETSVAARELSSADPDQVLSAQEIIINNFLKMQEQMAILASDGSRLISEQNAASANISYIQNVAENMFRGMIDNSLDIDAMMEQIESGDIEIAMLSENRGEPAFINVDPYLVLPRQRVEAIIRYGYAEANRRRTEDETASAAMVHSVRNSVDDSIARNANSGDGSLIPDEILLAADFTDLQILQYKEAFNDAGNNFSILQGMKGNSFEGRIAILQNLKEAVDVSGNDVDDQKMFGLAIKVNAQYEADLERDPAGVVMATDPALRKFASQLDTSPENFISVIGKSLEAQARQGVPSNLRRVLSNAEIESFKNQIASVEDSFELRRLLGSVQDQYGQYAPQVISEMIQFGKANRFLGVLMNLPLDDHSAGFFSELIMGNFTEIELSRPLGDRAKLIKEFAVSKFEEDFSPYLPPGNRRVGLLYMEAIHLLALDTATREGGDVEAVEQAFETLIGGQYEFIGGSVRVPKELYNNGVERGVSNINHILDSIVLDITPIDIFGSDARQPQADIDAAYIENLYLEGKLFTNRGETGVNIFDADGVAVEDMNGELITVTWDELSKIGLRSINADTTEVLGLGFNL